MVLFYPILLRKEIRSLEAKMYLPWGRAVVEMLASLVMIFPCALASAEFYRNWYITKHRLPIYGLALSMAIVLVGLTNLLAALLRMEI